MFEVLDLFSGIGGFSIGLERAGFRTAAFCEIEPYCRAVLRKHWPGVPCYNDVRTLTGAQLATDGIFPNVICGGFPCQDISLAGKGAGIEGERSGLWAEIRRLAGDIRPEILLLENVAALLGRGLDRVLGDLATLGYDAEWHCIPASAVGARHRRDRIWIMAYPQRAGLERHAGHGANGDQPGRQHAGPDGSTSAGGLCAPLADTERQRQWAGLCEGGAAEQWGRRSGDSSCAHDVSDPAPGVCTVRRWAPRQDGYPLWIDATGVGEIWRTEPNLGRVADGIPARVDRLSALGNAVVPQIPQIIGEAIMRQFHNPV